MNGATILSTVSYPPTPDRPWTVRITYALIDGKPAVGAVEVYAVDPDAIRAADPHWPHLDHRPPTAQPITSIGLRLPLGTMLSAYIARRRRTADIVAAAPSFPPNLRRSARKVLRQINSAAPERPRGRPPLYGREHYEDVAATYLDALASGRPTTQAVAARFGVSDSAASKWVATARHTWGLLPRTSKGRSAGWPASQRKERK